MKVNKTNSSYSFASLVRQCTAFWMMLLLLLLTSMNFFVYNGSFTSTTQIEAQAGGDSGSDCGNIPCNPSGPDEKPPGSNISVNEEYVHECDDIINPYIVNDSQYGRAMAEKLHVVHFEILLPPPKA